jgi:hypothetical protein
MAAGPAEKKTAHQHRGPVLLRTWQCCAYSLFIEHDPSNSRWTGWARSRSQGPQGRPCVDHGLASRPPAVIVDLHSAWPAGACGKENCASASWPVLCIRDGVATVCSYWATVELAVELWMNTTFQISPRTSGSSVTMELASRTPRGHGSRAWPAGYRRKLPASWPSVVAYLTVLRIQFVSIERPVELGWTRMNTPRSDLKNLRVMLTMELASRPPRHSGSVHGHQGPAGEPMHQPTCQNGSWRSKGPSLILIGVKFSQTTICWRWFWRCSCGALASRPPTRS